MAAALKALEAKGKKVIYGEDAQEDLPALGKHYMSGGYHELGETTWAGGKSQKVSEILGADFEPTLIQHPGTGRILKVATQQQVSAAAAGKRRKSKGAAHTGTPATRQGGAAAGDFELREKTALHIARIVAEKHPGTLGRAELLYLASGEHESWDAADDSLLKAFKLSTSGRVNLDRLKDKDIVRFLVAGAVTEGLINGYGRVEKFAESICKRFKVDPKKVAKELAKPPAVTSTKPAWSDPAVKVRKTISFTVPVIPSLQLAAITGPAALMRVEVTKKIWGYIKKHGLQDKKNKRMINADEKLRPIFAGKHQVSMFEMTKHCAAHLGSKTVASKSKKKK
jgi:upstream activation factor subunit UAF30